MPRLLPAAALAVIMAVWGAWQVYAGWGLVSLDFENAPLGRVLAAIERQGGISVASNLDPATPVTVQVRRVPAIEALDIVAVRVDASWRLAYLGAPNESAINAVLGDFTSGAETSNWKAHGAGGGGFNFIAPQSGEALDLRRVQWDPSGPGGLPALLEEASEETGVMLASPSDWAPEVGAPSPGPIAAAAPRLFQDAGGAAREVFLLRGRPAGDDEEAGGGGGRGGPWIGAVAGDGGERGRGWMRAAGDPERMQKRVEAQIALLPAAEQDKAREDFRMMREFWQSVGSLPEEQRRAKAQEFFSRPEVQERMEDRRLARYAKMTPKQRIERSQRYWERKAEAKYRGGGQ